MSTIDNDRKDHGSLIDGSRNPNKKVIVVIVPFYFPRCGFDASELRIKENCLQW